MQRSFLIAAGALWTAATLAGMAVLARYAHRAGPTGSAPVSWPAGISRDVLALHDRTLLVFLHPECPCSRATLAELERIAAHPPCPLAIRVYVNDSAGFEHSAREASLWKAAARIPGVQVLADTDGALARAFGAETSGASILYDRGGHLLFHGGITGARGHEGENASEDALLACLQQTPAAPIETNTYGCSIF